jgi:putative phosphoesterase
LEPATVILGIMSDSHGDADMTRRAVALLLERGATKLIHCGDICGEGVLDALAGHDCVFVWGNCDQPSARTQKYVESLGLTPPDGPLELSIAGKRIGVFHGHEVEFSQSVESGGFDYIAYGHTHKYRDDRVNGCRVINPGALYRARVHTAALLDLSKDNLRFIRIDDGLPAP